MADIDGDDTITGGRGNDTMAAARRIADEDPHFSKMTERAV